MKIVRVVHINLFDRYGGAARISWTLMDYMTEMGHDVAIFAHRKTSQDSRVIPIPFLQTKWQKKLLAQQSEQGLFDLYSAALLRVLTHPLFEQADIIHLHCINGNYFSFLLLPFLASKPLIWTLHDSLGFTANCLFTDFCHGWKDNLCAACPLDTEKDSEMQREVVQLIKSLIYKISNFTVVCPSAWLAQQAKESILQEKDIRLIYNGVDADIFKPGNKVELRFKLGLPTNKKIILFVAHGGVANESKGGKFLCEALLELYKQYPDIMLLTIGAYSEPILVDFSILHIDIPFIDNQQLLAEYYAAVDLYVSPTLTEVFGLTICEAMASGTPVVAFAVGGIPEVVIHKENGYLVERENVGELICGMSYFLGNEEIRQRTGKAARLRVIQHFNNKNMVDDYIELYEELLEKQQTTARGEVSCPDKEEILKIVENNRSKGWDFVWEEFHQIYSNFSEEQSVDRTMFVDQFCTYSLREMHPTSHQRVLWESITKWQLYRPMPERCSDLQPIQIDVFFEFIRTLQKSFYEHFKKAPGGKFIQLEEQQQNRLYILWQQLFFNDFLFLPSQNHEEFSYKDDNDSLRESNNIDYMGLMLLSMYRPMDAEEFNINIAKLWKDHAIPEYCKVILSFWLVHIPYYNLEEKHRQKILKYTPDLFALKIPNGSFIPLVNECTKALWRISYVGGNNMVILSAFGDFISFHMKQFFQKKNVPLFISRKKEKGRKIRVGYISRLFYGQAVSYYMVNRVIHHDKDKFEVYTFALGNTYDDMTKIFEKYSDSFRQFKNIDLIEDVYHLVRDIIDCQLDILIYTDIGMDPLTYMLAGIRLAPAQCVLVGHGTTSGLPTIDYYISGDFEPPDANSHYREKLVRLPNLGAAQYQPPFAEDIPVTRKDWKIPEDAIIFVSCANGIKHGQSRDALLVEILERIPKACILLKPCHVNNLDHQLGERIIAAARQAGVANRLFIVPPLGRIDALLAIADIQLDTYPYGGWTTTMEALYMGLPTITQEGEMARSRWGAHMLRALGVQEGIASNEKEYVEWAVHLAQDKDLRAQIKEKIIGQVKSVLFNGAAAQVPYEKALLNIYEERN
jgi:protein O-GlcNAc transferase